MIVTASDPCSGADPSMHVRRLRKALSWPIAALLAAVMAAPPGSAQVYVSEEDNFTNSSFVRTSDAVKADLFAGDHSAGVGAWSDALHSYQAILDRSGDEAVEVSDRTIVCGTEAVYRRILALPPAARDTYDRLFGGKATVLLEQGLRQFDSDALLDLADRYPFTAAAPRALQAVVALAAERGDWVRGAAALYELRRRDQVRSTDVARLAEALGQAGEIDALRRLRRFALTLADATLVVDGTPQPLRAYLEAVLEAGDVDGLDLRRRALARGNLHVETMATLPQEEAIFAPRLEPDPRRSIQIVDWPAVGATRVGGTLWAAGQLGIYRIDKPGGGGSVMRYDREFGKTAYSTIGDRELTPLLADDLLHLAFTERYESPTILERCQLVAIETSGSRVLYRQHLGGVDQPEELRDFVLEGPLARFGELLIAPGSRLGTVTECALFAFDRATGALRWARHLASGARVDRYEFRNQPTDARRAQPAPITLSDGVAYVTTNVGVVAAVDLLRARVRWRFRYNRDILDDPERYAANSYYDTGGWNRCAPIVLDDKLIVAPEDSRFLYVLARDPGEGGYLRLQDPLFKGDRDALLGVDADTSMLIFSVRRTAGPTRDQVFLSFERISDAGIGRVAETPPFEVEEQIAGRPLLVGRAFFLPTTKRLCRYDLDQDARLFSDHPVPAEVLRGGQMGDERRYFGNLSLHDDVILSASSRYVLRISTAP